jgi:hypothetical protein
MLIDLSTTPFRMVMSCPFCCKPHVDRGEWTTKLHKTHLCVDDTETAPEQGCGTLWRPSEYPTVGVATLQDTTYLDDEEEAQYRCRSVQTNDRDHFPVYQSLSEKDGTTDIDRAFIGTKQWWGKYLGFGWQKHWELERVK